MAASRAANSSSTAMPRPTILDDEDEPTADTTARESSPDPELEATELGSLRSRVSSLQRPSSASTAPDEDEEVEAEAAVAAALEAYRQATRSNAEARRNEGKGNKTFQAVRKFWKNNVHVTVEHVACRDHLALERTFLGYLRTSLALSMLGVIIAQMFRLEHSPTPNPIFGFYAVSIPASCICIGAAMLVALMGAYRFWRFQTGMVRGKAFAWGWEMAGVGLVIAGVVIMLFVLVVAIDIDKDVSGDS